MINRIASIVLLLGGLTAVAYGISQMIVFRPVPYSAPVRRSTNDTGVDTVLAENDRVMAHIDEVERASNFSDGRQFALFGVVLIVWAVGMRTQPFRQKASGPPIA